MSGSDKQSDTEADGSNSDWLPPALAATIPSARRKTPDAAPGVTVKLDIVERLVADDSGTTDFRTALIAPILTGPNGAVSVNGLNVQTELQHSRNEVCFGYGIQGFTRLGVAGSQTGDVNSLRGVEWHNANEGSGNVNSSVSFYSHGIDLADGTGTIGTVFGFLAGNHGHESRIRNASHAFSAINPSAGAPLTTGYHHLVSAGPGRWGFYGEGSAANAFSGAVRIGDTQTPTDKLEVAGFAKLLRGVHARNPHGRHELGSNQREYVVELFSTHSRAPAGLLVNFVCGSPNNRKQAFAMFADSAGPRAAIWSDGGATFRGILDVAGIRFGGSDIPLRRTVKIREGRHYIFTAKDVTRYLRFNNPLPVRLVVPSDASVDLPVGTSLQFEQAGKGTIHIVGEPAVAVHSRGGRKTLSGRFAVAELRKIAANQWVLAGDVRKAFRMPVWR